ncbi:MAG: GNAT family N-acetyltransferase, partial [Gemmatimonadetes bacterium]|nr:GNAT family N-acetyltransferase [Gemmatimonadota bacterium]
QQPVGIVSFLRIDADHRCIEVGHIWYVPQVQRSEVNTESLYLLLKHAFDDLGFRRVEWKCDALNARSKAAALRLGFKAEGVFRQHRIVRGRNRDTAWFALLDHEWPAIRAHFETWLAAPATARPSLTALNRTA